MHGRSEHALRTYMLSLDFVSIYFPSVIFTWRNRLTDILRTLWTYLSVGLGPGSSLYFLFKRKLTVGRCVIVFGWKGLACLASLPPLLDR
jgi:hypothetical protein